MQVVNRPSHLFSTFQELAVLDSKRGRRGSGSDRVASVQPISLGRKVEVDLKGKQKKFEGLDRQAEQVGDPGLQYFIGECRRRETGDRLAQLVASMWETAI